MTPPARPKKKASMASVRKAFRTIIWPRRKLILVGLGLIVVSRLCAMVLPLSTKVLIDDVIGAGTTPLGLVLVVVGGAVTVQATSTFLLTRLLSIEAQRLIAELRVMLQKHVIRLKLSYFDSTKTGTLVSRVMSDVEGVRNLVGTGLVQMVGGTLQSVVAFAVLLSLNPKLTLLAIVPLTLFGFVASRAFKRIRPIFRERRRIESEVTGRLTESLGGIRVIKGFNAEAREEAVFAEGADRIFRNVKPSLTLTSLVTSTATLLLGLASVTLMGIGGVQIMGGHMTIGEFVAFSFVLGFMVTPVLQMANIGTQFTEAFAGLDRMDELLEVEREGDDPRRTVSLDRLEGRVRFENVSFAYEGGSDVVHDLTFEAPPGSVIALVGSSGSGKTTIAGLAASFLRPRTGTVYVDGVDLSTVVLESYRGQLGVVLQDDFLFEGTIRENILFGRPDADEAALVAAVESANVAEFTDRFEKGLDTLIGERGVKLSGGQRQRVAIARALIADPRVLILDEATSNLDTESESMIQASLRELMAGRTTFVIAHRLSTIRRADQILVIEDGRIVERGRHDDLLAAEGRYHDLYTYQARI